MDFTVALTVDLLTIGLAENDIHIGNKAISKINRVAGNKRPLFSKKSLNPCGSTAGSKIANPTSPARRPTTGRR